MSAGGYYDIDSILSEEVRVPCVFALDAVGMGMLDPTTSDEDLSQGAKVRRSLLLVPTGCSGVGREGASVHHACIQGVLCRPSAVYITRQRRCVCLFVTVFFSSPTSG